MGLTHKSFLLKSTRSAKKETEIEFLIDSGAIYSLAPASVLKKLGIKPYKTVDFFMVDGTKLTRKVGDAYFEFNGDGGAAPIIFGEKGDEPLLGATALESIGLVLNPFKRELFPMRMLLV